MLRFSFFSLLVLTLSFGACVGDDFIDDYVEPTIRITNALDSLEINTNFAFEYTYFNNVGKEENIDATWISDQPTIVNIDQFGVAQALQMGTATLRVEYQTGGLLVSDDFQVHVGDNTVIPPDITERSGTIKTTSSYVLEGDFNLKALPNGNLELVVADNYKATSALPGLYVYLTNNPSTTSGALEIAKVTTFSGTHSYQIPNVGLQDYSHVLYFCKPFNVKVGDGLIEN